MSLSIVAVRGNGGGASRFELISPEMPDDVDLRAVTLPGFSTAPKDPTLPSLGDYADRLARSIDAGWIPTLTLVSAVVVETGGDLSHGSILLRERGVPAITNVRGITRTVRTGETLDIRAGAGVVERLIPERT